MKHAFLNLARRYGAMAVWQRTYERGGSTYWANDAQKPYYDLVNDDGAIHLWKVNETAPSSGTDYAYDSIGTEHLIYSSSYGHTQAAGPLTDNGLQSNDNANQFYETGSSSEFAEGQSAISGISDYPYTLECWVKMSAAHDVSENPVPIMAFTSGQNWNAISIRESGQGRGADTSQYAVIESMQNTPSVWGSTDVLTQSTGVKPQIGKKIQGGDWHHIVATFTSSKRVLYFDGRHVAEDTTIPAFAAGKVHIGTITPDTGGGMTTAGSCTRNIACASVYPTVLGAQQIANHYIAGLRHFDLKLSANLLPKTVAIHGDPYSKGILFPEGSSDDELNFDPELRYTGALQEMLDFGEVGAFACVANVRRTGTDEDYIFDAYKVGCTFTWDAPKNPSGTLTYTSTNNNDSGFKCYVNASGNPVMAYGYPTNNTSTVTVHENHTWIPTRPFNSNRGYKAIVWNHKYDSSSSTGENHILTSTKSYTETANHGIDNAGEMVPAAHSSTPWGGRPPGVGDQAYGSACWDGVLGPMALFPVQLTQGQAKRLTRALTGTLPMRSRPDPRFISRHTRWCSPMRL